MGNRGQEGDGRALGPFGRRGILRRTSGADNPGTSSAHMNMLALMSERYAASGASRDDEGDPSMAPGARGSSRRQGMDDLEEIMMMEAIRLSLASEEDRRRKEEKDAQKKAKKKDKEDKKAEKKARKTGVYPSSANASAAGFGGSSCEGFIGDMEFPTYSGKGKGVQQTEFDQANLRAMSATPSSTAADPQEHLERARAQILPSDAPPFPTLHSSSPYRPSHLRTLSNASSSTSSIDGSAPGSLKSDVRGQGSSFDVSPSASGVNIPAAVSAQDTYISGTPPGGGAGMEPMFNFRSLAAMVGEEKSKGIMHDENAGQSHGLPRGESSSVMTDKVGQEEGTSTELHDGSGLHSTGESQPPLPVPAFKLTAASRGNSDFDKAGQQVEYAEIKDATVAQERSQTSI